VPAVEKRFPSGDIEASHHIMKLRYQLEKRFTIWGHRGKLPYEEMVVPAGKEIYQLSP